MPVITLTEKQAKIASFTNGALLVKASAGSGKTRVLTERIKHLIKVSKRKILAITFTNKASDEIMERLRDCEDVNDKLFVGTFHAFCNYVLLRHGHLIGYQHAPQIFEKDADRMKIIEDVISDISSFEYRYKEKNEKERNQFKYDCLEAISKIKRNVILDRDLKQYIQNNDIILLYLNYRKYLKSLNAIDYDDLLLETYNLFINNPSIASLYRRSYEYVCVDESQDMNKAQYMVLKALIGNKIPNIMLVGDVKQCIYGFIGSDSKYMMEDFVKDYHPAIFELTENFRSSRKVLEFANKIIPGSSELKDVVKEGRFELLDFATPEEEAQYVCDKIRDLILTGSHPDIEGDITYNKISVLGRTKYVLQPVEDELQKNSIPYFYKNTQRTFELESSLGKIFELALKVRNNSNDFLHLNELSDSFDGLYDISSLSELSLHLQNGTKKRLIDLVISLNDDGGNFINVLNEISRMLPNEYSSDDSEKVLACSDFELIKKAWYKYAKSTNNKSLVAFHNSISLGQSSSFEEKNGVALSTVHTMKGQENDIVFLVGMDDGTFPDYRAIQKGGVDLQQERNDLYVAVTRAKRFLYVTYPKERIMPWGTIFYRKKSSLLPSD